MEDGNVLTSSFHFIQILISRLNAECLQAKSEFLLYVQSLISSHSWQWFAVVVVVVVVIGVGGGANELCDVGQVDLFTDCNFHPIHGEATGDQHCQRNCQR